MRMAAVGAITGRSDNIHWTVHPGGAACDWRAWSRTCSDWVVCAVPGLLPAPVVPLNGAAGCASVVLDVHVLHP